jgi:hypothetical protein
MSVSDSDFETRLTRDLGRLADRAPAGPTPAEVLRTLRAREDGRSRDRPTIRLFWVAALPSVASAAAAALVVWVALRGPAATEVPPPPVPLTPATTAAAATVADGKATSAPPPTPPTPTAPLPASVPRAEAVRFDPLPVDVRLDVLRSRLEAVPLLASAGRVVVRKQPDAPMVLLVSAGAAPADGGGSAPGSGSGSGSEAEAETEAVAEGLETMLASFEEVRITMEAGRVVSAILVRSRGGGVTVRQAVDMNARDRPRLGGPPMPRAVKMGT